MLFAERDKDGKIIAIRHAADEKATEPVSGMDEELLAFFKNINKDPFAEMLSASDFGVIRVVEDLIDLLISKNVILFTDLPLEAQQKIKTRKNIRQKIDDHNFMVDDII